MAEFHPVPGFIGLGQMGQPMAANIAKAGFNPVCFDSAGTIERTPQEAISAASPEEVAARADSIFLSLPNGNIVQSVIEQIIASPDRCVSTIIDLSTIGPEAASTAADTLNKAGITFIDAFCGNPFHVGDTPGQGQALKLLNNFLSATAMAATSEAILFGLSHGLAMKTMLDVVNVSTGQNTATRDKFPQRVLTGTYDAGFFAEHLNKDVQLYINEVHHAATPSQVGDIISDIWQSGTDSFEPGTDFTRIYDYISQHKP